MVCKKLRNVIDVPICGYFLIADSNMILIEKFKEQMMIEFEMTGLEILPFF